MSIYAEIQYSAELTNQLQQALIKQGPDYKPRTEFLLPDGKPKYTNRLILEDSPYLIQHAHNPVNWYAWGAEAFAKAKAENKPVFLSIGYSTCHWCHVMERESFDNEQLAEYINELKFPSFYRTTILDSTNILRILSISNIQYFSY